MPYAVDLNTVSTGGLELSPVAAALAGQRQLSSNRGLRPPVVSACGRNSLS